SAARAAARSKPVMVVRSGRAERIMPGNDTHVQALARADDVYGAAFNRAGLLRVGALDELFTAAETLGRLGSFPGRRLAILSNGGGVGRLAVDQLAALRGPWQACRRPPSNNWTRCCRRAGRVPTRWTS